MATFNITAPDGRKFKITGENMEGAVAALERKLSIDAGPKAYDPNEIIEKPVNKFGAMRPYTC